MSDATSVAIIGAGPYGLSLAAHLKEAGVAFRIFGSPMEVWRNHMPAGMLLKSYGFASTIADPRRAFTLKAFCLERGIPYEDVRIPVKLETFVAYGLEFQKRVVPELEDRLVEAVERLSRGFCLRFGDGGSCQADRVVVAVGISHFAYVPEALQSLPADRIMHSSAQAACGKFAGRDVTVIGAGASAVDAAANLLQAGATVRIVARTAEIKHNGPPAAARPSLARRVYGRLTLTGLGSGWRNVLCTRGPLLFRLLPQPLRHRIVASHLGPLATWWAWSEIEGKVPLLTGTRVAAASCQDGRVELHLVNASGEALVLATDQVVAATGYRADLRRLPFLDEPLRSAIRSIEHSPVLTAHFESSVPGLYFVGLASANTFGPLLRFAYGAGFASRRLSRHLRRTRRTPSETSTPGPAVTS